MTTTNPTISPIICAPWCEYGDGHPNEHFPQDQTCWGSATYVALSLEPADVDQDGDPYPARVGAMAHRPYNEAAVVNLHTELCGFKNIDTCAHLTPDEARALAEALTTTADQVDGIKLATTEGDGRTESCQLRDVRRRIRNMLDRFPASGWDLAESEAVLAALAGIVRGRPEGERLPS
jgi:hypothetical protein